MESHPGYWWLAFDLSNFRYCCTYCNSRRKDSVTGQYGGKQDSFPLFDEGTRAYPEADPADTNENPVLLDPIEADDAIYLYFADDGDVHPRFAKASEEIIRRVDVSIDVYNLNHTDLTEARLELFNRLRISLDLGKNYFKSWHDGDPSAQAAFKAAVEPLKLAVRDDAEFTTAAKDMIRGWREDGHPWIDALI